ncbi:MAG: hypothetical protein GY934_22370, partial [Gammaproteobacteria bacterium]|nr:hypothetical protein [Gammaproteobacteria bacterium]
LLLGWLERNFGLSLIPFSATLLLYLLSLNQLAKKLAQQRPQDEIDQLEHLIDVWTSLFFGIGVIWTAIGMRGALLYALGDIGQTDGGQAAAVLQRLVDGGILTALSTTIAGGVGGYLMRLYKTLVLGVRLNRYYRQQEMLPGSRIEQLLTDISQSVAVKSVATLPISEPPENGVSK